MNTNGHGDGFNGPEGMRNPYVDRLPGELPPWITTKPGLPAALDIKRDKEGKVVISDKELASHLALQEQLSAKSAGSRRHVSGEQKFVEHATNRYDAHGLNLQVFRQHLEDTTDRLRMWHVENLFCPENIDESQRPLLEAEIERAKDQIKQHAHAAAIACRDLGEFEDALNLLPEAADADGNVRLVGVAGTVPLAALVAEIQAWKAAVERPDDELCACETPTITVPDVTHLVAPDQQRQVDVVAPKHQRVGQVRSKIHEGKVVDIWRCTQCGDLNAHSNGNAEHSRLEQIRREYERHFRSNNLSAREVALRPEFEGDHIHLIKNVQN